MISPSGIASKLLRSEAGTSAVEFALLAPAVLMMMVMTADMGRAWWQSGQVERNLKAAGEYASRVTLDDGALGPKDRDTILNIARFGQTPQAHIMRPDASGPLNVPDAVLGVEVKQKTISDRPAYIIRITAQKKYEPLFPGLAAMFGLEDWRIEAAHEDVNISQ